MGNKLAGAGIYEDFEPSYQWYREQTQDVLHIYLRGFEREQIHVKPEKGSLVIWGERPIDPPKRQRFRKEFSLPKNCKEEEIHAQFSAISSNKSYIYY
ncbi:hypothetical protein L6164_033490 [Bauhinia variegata]|uniref:Uncharacterized protein n=1 Tax=Bauhinia variegata TaxID=167791 RepID=A0ACB9KSQ7_BAUVA|nr:hypothetical protein L6164_033490 [Bauhinia variegata]